MCYDIQIGNYRLAMLDSVTIKRSVENLADTAEIVLPATVFNKSLNIEEKIKKGDEVTIKLGYDDNTATEFKGFLNAICTDNDKLTLQCEDDLYLFRQSLKNKELKNVSIKKLLEHVVAEISAAIKKSIKIDCDYDFTYDKFVLNNSTGYDVLKKVHEEANPNIYLKDDTLHVHAQYMQIDGEAAYNFAINIDRSGTDLKYMSAKDRKVLVVVEGKDKQGNTIKVEAGTSGGDKITKKIDGVTSISSLENTAKEELTRRVFDGYEGSITGWLIPYCDAGFKVSIRDDEHEYKNGNYYVLAVETSFSSEGGKRKITLGAKI